MAKIQKGDQFAIPIKIAYNGGFLKPGDCDEVIVKVNDITKKYYTDTTQTSTLAYNVELGVWEFPVTSQQTRNFPTVVGYQVGIKNGNTLKRSSVVNTINVAASIINEEDW